uniref:Putative hydroxypyruvate isomerase n=1 Tax=Strigamia maritima TaxID=126957 RepID=T1J8Z1_STRMM
MSRMAFRIAANLSFMFKEHSNLLDRYTAAKNAGFNGVEVGFPYDVSIEELATHKINAGLEQVLLNSWPGDLSKGELGLAAIPGRQEEFIKTLDTSIQYAKALNCSRIHIVAGKKVGELNEDEMDSVYEENLIVAVEKLKKEKIVALIEPINNYSVPNYYMNNYNKALKIIHKINSPYLKIQLDFYHLQILCGNLTNNVKDLLPFVGHIQIAQVPDRNEPNTPGEINYNYVFNLLAKLGYSEWIGCEYTPKSDVVKGLNWVKEFDMKF